MRSGDIDDDISVGDDALDLDTETMRRLGYQTVDMLLDWSARRRDEPAVRRASRSVMRQRLEEPAPEAPSEFSTVLKRVAADVLPFTSRLDHPRYFAFIPGFGTWPAALGDFIASACNVYAGSWYESAGPSQLELTVLDWFKSLIGYPPAAGGILLSGGSAANMTALACAREACVGAMSPESVVYVSDQAHSSMARAARALGFRSDQVRVLPVDDRYRMRPDTLRSVLRSDVEAGHHPLLVSASAGSTNTGAIDPLAEIAAVCKEYAAWFHVDGAYGAFAALTERGRTWLSGIEAADSVTLDPHKWLYQPFECGCLLARDGRLLRQAFEITPDYLNDSVVGEEEVNFSDFGMQLTRMSRALKVWMSIQYFGLDAFRLTIDRCLDLARHAQQRIESSRNLELLNPATLGIVCFRRRLDGHADEDKLARVNADLVTRLIDSGLGMISSTRLQGRYALRLCVLNHTTRRDDVDRILDWSDQVPVNDAPPTQRSVLPERHPHVDQGWMERPSIDAAELAELPILASLSEVELALLRTSVWELEAKAGERIVRQWEASSDFYVLLDGAAEVRVGTRYLDALRPGDFFGELAALDWGAGFGYPRLASVIATVPSRVLVMPGETFRRLVRSDSSFAAEIRRAARERLPGL